MSLRNKTAKDFLLTILTVVVALHLSGCASFGKSEEATDENGNSMAADLDGAGADESAATDSNVNPDLAKDALTESNKSDDLGINDPPQAEISPNLKLDLPPGEVQKPSEADVNNAEANKNEKTIVAEVATSSANPFNQDVEITNVKYNADKNGGTLSIETSAPATFRKREGTNPNQIVIEVANTKIPAKFLRPLVTKDFKQSIASVYAYQDKGSTTARFVVQMRDKASANIQQEGKVILVAAESFTDDSKGQASSDAGIRTFNAPNSIEAKRSQNNEDTSLRFYGKPINIEVRDTPIVDVLNFISEQSGANLLIGSDVKGQITLKLKQVPWDQALLLVMKSQQLGYVREGSVLRIAPLDTLKSESDKAAKVLESQHDAEPLKVKIIPVSYAKVEELGGQLASFLSKRGKVVFDKRTSSVVITDIVENLERASNLVKALDTPPFQVLIEGKIVEASQTFARNIGIQWGLSGSQVTTGAQTLTPTFNIAPTATATAVGLGFNWGTFDSLGSINAQLQLFESENQVKVVSSPRVVTVNNETANITQNLKIPIQTVTATAGATTTSTTFSDVDLVLSVTPQITAESDVIMAVNLKRSFLGTAGGGSTTPPVNVRSAATKVMVRNGQTAVIGGIYQADNQTDENGVPVLKNLPVVGWLFKSKNHLEQKNELILFLTPRILNIEHPGDEGAAL